MVHERIILVLLGYVIGFTTAFIAFSLAPNIILDSDVASFGDGVTTQYASASEPNTITFEETGLYVVKNGQQIIVSGKLQDGIDPGPGFHVSVSFSQISPSGDYIYYCEQETTSSETCNQYVYNADTHTAHPLKHNGANLTASISGSGFSWNSKNILTNNKLKSISSNKPWMLNSID
ncbi:MAG: hypothetical protein ACI9VM_000873 [Candidatus Azotimanducaceae bacterium]|jgi:hypothetical protein